MRKNVVFFLTWEDQPVPFSIATVGVQDHFIDLHTVPHLGWSHDEEIQTESLKGKFLLNHLDTGVKKQRHKIKDEPEEHRNQLDAPCA